jgi:DNA-binding response OmpR family regulator
MTNLDKNTLILIVEDEEILAGTLEKKLDTENFEVVKASDGEEGLRLALDRHPDLILLDLLMPKIDGLAMLKKLREDSWGLHADVIILTNISDPDKVAEGMNTGPEGTYEYLIKSNWSLDEIVSRIKQKLEITT